MSSGLSSSILIGASELIGQQCRSQNIEFMKCKQSDTNPSACLDKGSSVLTCVTGTLEKINKKCKAEFEGYASCLSNNNGDYSACRDQQATFREAWASVE
jgi:NADH dehydrogenase (ubiquinone) 1 alpha subcomplex subunit 8|tara:strand:- start:332 stop:631 length:300 start_codon:yes stop_codon:yes gene_type:complete